MFVFELFISTDETNHLYHLLTIKSGSSDQTKEIENDC